MSTDLWVGTLDVSRHFAPTWPEVSRTDDCSSVSSATSTTSRSYGPLLPAIMKHLMTAKLAN